MSLSIAIPNLNNFPWTCLLGEAPNVFSGGGVVTETSGGPEPPSTAFTDLPPPHKLPLTDGPTKAWSLLRPGARGLQQVGNKAGAIQSFHRYPKVNQVTVMCHTWRSRYGEAARSVM
ncbi:hypothetical protein CRG98_006224 [Punica granatum]|uniref:Uncharacterized protein n=1 Tax=Punica granatum TaxID=22663 RepID=A0A2I0KZI4_PUNGR|nr:hypothetical protein CRG98_006224 [Punica granatum]